MGRRFESCRAHQSLHRFSLFALGASTVATRLQKDPSYVQADSNARVARYRRLHQRARTPNYRSAAGADTARQPLLLRTAQPPLASVEGRTVRELRRIG